MVLFVAVIWSLTVYKSHNYPDSHGCLSCSFQNFSKKLLLPFKKDDINFQMMCFNFLDLKSYKTQFFELFNFTYKFKFSELLAFWKLHEKFTVYLNFYFFTLKSYYLETSNSKGEPSSPNELRLPRSLLPGPLRLYKWVEG